MKKLYAIGDIHGMYDQTVELLVKIREDIGNDYAKIVFIGDYVDRGPDSRKVIELIISLKTMMENPDSRIEFVFLKGNHEDMMLSDHSMKMSGSWLGNGGYETLDSYMIDVKNKVMDREALDAHIEWLRNNLVISHRDGKYFFVHAGINPYVPLDEQDKDQMIWSRTFTSYGGDYPEGVFVVHGHTPMKNPDLMTNRLNIDTGCVFGSKIPNWGGHEGYGNLTAVVLHEDKPRFIQARSW